MNQRKTQLVYGFEFWAVRNGDILSEKYAARHGRTLGGYRGSGAGRGQRLVPLHGNPPPEFPRAGQAGFRGDCRRCHALRGIGPCRLWEEPFLLNIHI